MAHLPLYRILRPQSRLNQRTTSHSSEIWSKTLAVTIRPQFQPRYHSPSHALLFLTVFAIIGSGQITVTNPAQTFHYLTEKKQVAAETNSASTFALALLI